MSVWWDFLAYGEFLGWDACCGGVRLVWRGGRPLVVRPWTCFGSLLCFSLCSAVCFDRVSCSLLACPCQRSCVCSCRVRGGGVGCFTRTKPGHKLCVSFPKGATVKPTVSPSSPGGSNHRRVGLILLKALYGIKQSPLLWSQEIAKIFTAIGHTRSASDLCISFNIEGSERIECVVFVDDLFVVSKSIRMIKTLKAVLETRFNNKIGVVPWVWTINSFLGIVVQYEQDKNRRRCRSPVDSLVNGADARGVAAAGPRFVVGGAEARVDAKRGLAAPAAEGVNLRPRRAGGEQAVTLFLCKGHLLRGVFAP